MPRRIPPAIATAPLTTLHLHAPPPPSPLIQRLRQDVRWAAISQFCWMFSDAFGLLDWDIENLEADFDGDETQLIPALLVKLLFALTYNRQINLENVMEHIRKQYTKRTLKCPLGTVEEPVEWPTLGPGSKVQILYDLCELQMEDPARFRALLKTEEDAVQWRIDPLGWDKDGNTYFLFDDNRLWIQRLPPAPPPPPRPPKKSSLKAKRALKRQRHAQPLTDSEQTPASASATASGSKASRSRSRPSRPSTSSHRKKVQQDQDSDLSDDDEYQGDDRDRGPTPPPRLGLLDQDPIIPFSGSRKRTQVAFYGNPLSTVDALKRGSTSTPGSATRRMAGQNGVENSVGRSSRSAASAAAGGRSTRGHPSGDIESSGETPSKRARTSRNSGGIPLEAIFAIPSGPSNSNSKAKRNGDGNVNGKGKGKEVETPKRNGLNSAQPTPTLTDGANASGSRSKRTTRRSRGGLGAEDEEWEQIPEEWLRPAVDDDGEKSLTGKGKTRGSGRMGKAANGATMPISTGRTSMSTRAMKQEDVEAETKDDPSAQGGGDGDRDEDENESDLSELTDEEEHEKMVQRAGAGAGAGAGASVDAGPRIQSAGAGEAFNGRDNEDDVVMVDQGTSEPAITNEVVSADLTPAPEAEESKMDVDDGVPADNAMPSKPEGTVEALEEVEDSSTSARAPSPTPAPASAEETEPVDGEGNSDALPVSAAAATSDEVAKHAQVIEKESTNGNEIESTSVPMIPRSAPIDDDRADAEAPVDVDEPKDVTGPAEAGTATADSEIAADLTHATSAAEPLALAEGQIEAAGADLQGDTQPGSALPKEEDKPDTAIATATADANATAASEEAKPEVVPEQQVEEEEEEDETDEVKLAVKESKKLPEGFIEWEAVCVTLYDWRTWPEQFAKSKDPDEKLLYGVLEAAAPTVIDALVIKEQERLKQIAVANRKRSSRIATRELEKEEQLRQEQAQREMEERMEKSRSEESRKKREEAELLEKERAREERLKEREHRLMARAEMEKEEKEKAERLREDRYRNRENGSKATGPDSGSGSGAGAGAAAGAGSTGADAWELACEVCKKSGWNLDGEEDIVACEDCAKWQHMDCHDQLDMREGRHKRNWDKVEFRCKECRRRAARQHLQEHRQEAQHQLGAQSNGHTQSMVAPARSASSSSRQMPTSASGPGPGPYAHPHGPSPPHALPAPPPHKSGETYLPYPPAGYTGPPAGYVAYSPTRPQSQRQPQPHPHPQASYAHQQPQRPYPHTAAQASPGSYGPPRTPHANESGHPGISMPNSGRSVQLGGSSNGNGSAERRVSGSHPHSGERHLSGSGPYPTAGQSPEARRPSHSQPSPTTAHAYMTSPHPSGPPGRQHLPSPSHLGQRPQHYAPPPSASHYAAPPPHGQAHSQSQFHPQAPHPSGGPPQPYPGPARLPSHAPPHVMTLSGREGYPSQPPHAHPSSHSHSHSQLLPHTHQLPPPEQYSRGPPGPSMPYPPQQQHRHAHADPYVGDRDRESQLPPLHHDSRHLPPPPPHLLHSQRPPQPQPLPPTHAGYAGPPAHPGMSNGHARSPGQNGHGQGHGHGLPHPSLSPGYGPSPGQPRHLPPHAIVVPQQQQHQPQQRVEPHRYPTGPPPSSSPSQQRP